MNQYLTNENLLSILKDIEYWMRNSPAWNVLMGSKVKRFNEQNQLRISNLHNESQKLIDRHVEKDNKGVPVILAFADGQKFKFKSDDDEKEYLTSWSELMKQSFDVHL